MVEKFDTKFAMNYPNDYQDIRFQKYSQNKTKEWKDPYQAYNAPIVQTYGITFNDFYKLNQYIFNDFEKGMIDKFVKKYTQPFESNDDDYLIAFTPFDIYNLNRETWYNRFNWNADYALYLKYLESKFQEVNIMNRFFMYLFNDYWYNFILDYVKRNVILYKSYFIWKYRIVNIFNSKEQVNGLPKNRIFDVVLVTTRDEGLIAFEFFLRGLFVYKGENYEMDNLEINYVANYTLDKILMREGIDKNNLKFNVNPLYKNDDPIPSADAEKIYAKEKEKYFEERNFLDYSYACFTYKRNSLDPIATPMFATDKNDCQNKYTLSGQEKPAGVWDRPCQKNEDCLFFRRNKNYDNDFGKCTKGFCELPMNMRNLGYHYYIDSPRRKPLCYNCKSDRWLPNTKTDFCCEEQKDKKKYPFLDGPDYAFKGDSMQRYNQYVAKNCVMRPNYDNIFKSTNVWKVDCKGFLDSYVLDYESQQQKPLSEREKLKKKIETEKESDFVQ